VPLAHLGGDMTVPTPLTGVRRKAVWGPKRTLAALMLLTLGIAPGALAQTHSRPAPTAPAGAPSARVKNYKLDGEVTRRKNGNPQQISSVIVTLVAGAELPPQFKRFAHGGKLDIINGQVLDLPNGVLKQLEAHPDIFRVHYNRPTSNFNYRTSVTVGAAAVRQTYGYTGAGVGVAVIDSGIANWHDDLSGASGLSQPYGAQRVAAFVDFVNGQTQPYDDNGHGTHVSGIIAGNGFDSRGERAGIAPSASLVSLKVLDANGVGTIGNMIAALNWVAANHTAYSIRVVNMSVGARITESYWTDPLTLATKALVDRGVVVVGAAGNFGKNAQGNLQYGGITAPANAPWVLTVGASSTQGTLTRNDDIMASYSSAGPTYIDFGAKPDLVAPGTGTVSLAAPGSTFYTTKSQYLVNGKPAIGYQPYLTLSGTSMAAPVVAGSVALMLEANPRLTPNLVKAILQYTAQQYAGYSTLRQGAGFLNTLGAVRLARFYAHNTVGSRMPVQKVWSKQIVWGSHRLSGGYINPKANAWALSVNWGAARALDDDNIIWGTDCDSGDCDNIIWGTDDADGDNVIWGTDVSDWGTEFIGDNVIWGTEDADNVIWGTDCGGADCDNVIWGTEDTTDNVIWGTADEGDMVIWGTNDGDNVIWGTSSEFDVTWGNASGDEVLYPDDEELLPIPDPSLEFGDVVTEDEVVAPATSTTTVDPVTDSTSAVLGGL
jgi:serine protease AprX